MEKENGHKTTVKIGEGEDKYVYEPIVKVFIIEDSKDGSWVDAGAGNVNIVRSTKCLNTTSLDPKDFELKVKEGVEGWPRDFIDPRREKKLRGESDDKNIILHVPLGEAKEFMRTQSKRWLCSIDCTLGTDGYKRKHSTQFFGSVGMQRVLERDMPDVPLRLSRRSL